MCDGEKKRFSRRDLNIHIYFQTYSPVIRTTSSRVLIQLAPITGKKIWQLDVKQAFPSEPKLKKTFMSEIYNKFTTRKTSEKRTKNNQKIPSSSVQKKPIFSHKKEVLFLQRREQATQLFYHTHIIT